jgi:SOS-response transcriptional repressor LexA
VDVDRLKALMKERKESQVGIARLLGITPDKLNKTLKGKRLLKLDEANRLRRYFGIRDELSEEERPALLPVVGLVSAGAWKDGFEGVTDWIPAPDRSLSRDSFVVRVEGDSMDQVAQEGEHVIVDPRDLDLIAGKYYVVRNNDGQTTFKQYCDNPARLAPCSSNPRHGTIFIGREGFTLVGRVRKKVSNL